MSLVDLPTEVLAYCIFPFCSPRDISEDLYLVCKEFHKIIQEYFDNELHLSTYSPCRTDKIYNHVTKANTEPDFSQIKIIKHMFNVDEEFDYPYDWWVEEYLFLKYKNTYFYAYASHSGNTNKGKIEYTVKNTRVESYNNFKDYADTLLSYDYIYDIERNISIPTEDILFKDFYKK